MVIGGLVVEPLEVARLDSVDEDLGDVWWYLCAGGAHSLVGSGKYPLELGGWRLIDFLLLNLHLLGRLSRLRCAWRSHWLILRNQGDSGLS
jgi:hypothetical protein